MSQPQTDSRFWRRVKDIFDAAWDLPEAERENYLASACGTDAELRAEVEAMLAPEDDDSAEEIIIDRPLPFTPAAHIYSDLKGQVAGRYRLVREIGRGGMSVVYLGERADGDFEHRVAVKILRPGLESSGVGWRFSQERRILARLTHPHIARLIDGGETSNNLSYVVMEYIDGEPITDYCENHNLPLEARLQLFLTVCAAAAHAHRHLIIHRDLKPSNIFVTNDGVPKLLDFGIAKLLDASDGESQKTMTGLHLMTPDYASPEQVRGDEITTTGDIYSLGVVLYELLAGVRPHRLRNLSMREIVRVICEQEPRRPSAAAKTGFREQLRGDLDQIVMKALRKEPDLRYESVDQLSDDLRRYLKGEPVSAQRDTLRYRTVKFIRRNRALTAALAAVVLLLVLVLGGTFRQLIAERARTREQYRMAYAMSVQQAKDNIREGDTERARAMLGQYLPGRGPEDLRGFEWRHLWHSIHRELYSLDTTANHQSVIIPPSPHLEINLPDGVTRLHEMESGRLAYAFRRDFDLGDETKIRGKIYGGFSEFVVLRDAREVQLLDRVSNRLLNSFAVPGAPVAGISCAHGDCRRVWVVQEGGAVSLWDSERRTELYRVETGRNDILFVEASADSPSLMLMDRGFDGHIFNRQKKRVVISLSGDKFPPLRISPSGRFVLQWILEGECRIYDTTDGRLIRTIDGEGGLLYTNWTNAPPDGVIVFWYQDGPKDRAMILAPPDFRRVKTFGGPAGTVILAAVPPDGKLVFTVGADRMIRVWDYESEREIAAVAGLADEIRSIQVSDDGRLLLTATRGGVSKVWKVEELLRPAAISPDAGKIFSVAVSPDGKTLAAAAQDRRVLLYDIETGRSLKTLNGHTGIVLCVAFSPDGRLIASSGEDQTARIWDVSTGNELLRFNHARQIHSVAFSPDGRRIATGSDDRSVKVWDAATGATIRNFDRLPDLIWSISFDPSGRRLAAGDYQGIVRIWDLDSEREPKSFQTHTNAVWSIRLTRDGSKILTSSMDRTARLSDVASGRELLVFKGHTDEVFEAVFSPDETRIVTASNDNTVKIWNAATGEELLTLKDHRNEVWSVDFSKDGKLLVSAGWDGVIRLYRTQ